MHNPLRDSREPRYEMARVCGQGPDGSTDERQDRDEPGRRPRQDPGRATSQDGPGRTRDQVHEVRQAGDGPGQAQSRTSQVSTKFRTGRQPETSRHEATATSGQFKSDTQCSRSRHSERVRTGRQGKDIGGVLHGRSNNECPPLQLTRGRSPADKGCNPGSAGVILHTVKSNDCVRVSVTWAVRRARSTKVPPTR